MTTHDQIPPPPESSVRLRTPRKAEHGRARGTAMTVEKAPPAAGDRDELRRALLRAQPWGRILAQLTAIALKRIRGRSLQDAEDLAQGAIADAYRGCASGGWDPEKAPLMSFLVAHVIGASANERRRKRNVCEVWLDEEVEDMPGLSVHEKHLAEDAPPPDEALHRLRLASTFDERLTARVSHNEVATALLPHMRKGISKPSDLQTATGRSIEEVQAAREVIRYHAGEITKELSATAGAPRGRSSGPKEVIQ
jgi:DNA-directed RNA polymerase specialized sigma24 family protein